MKDVPANNRRLSYAGLSYPATSIDVEEDGLSILSAVGSEKEVEYFFASDARSVPINCLFKKK